MKFKVHAITERYHAVTNEIIENGGDEYEFTIDADNSVGALRKVINEFDNHFCYGEAIHSIHIGRPK